MFRRDGLYRLSDNLGKPENSLPIDGGGLPAFGGAGGDQGLGWG
jgi:hypothetical protein